MKGAYLLVLELRNDASIQVGKHGVVDFQKGWYVYVGSALNGLEQRIQRHLQKQKKIHWHIDYLLPFTEVVDIFYKENVRRDECRIARMFDRNISDVSGFGCSDCTCSSHLYTGSFQDIRRIIDSLEMESYLLHTNP
jgi:Uri superfamily endonuclease